MSSHISFISRNCLTLWCRFRVMLLVRKAVLQQSETSTAHCSKTKTMVHGWRWQEVGYVIYSTSIYIVLIITKSKGDAQQRFTSVCGCMLITWVTNIYHLPVAPTLQYLPRGKINVVFCSSSGADHSMHAQYSSTLTRVRFCNGSHTSGYSEPGVGAW